MVKELTADWNRLHALLSESYGHWYDKLKKKVHTKKGRAFFKNILPSMLSARTKEERKVFLLPSPRKKRRVFFPRSPGLPRSIWRVWNGRFAFFWRKLNSWKERNGNWGEKRLSSISKKMQKPNSSNLFQELVQLALLLSYQRLKKLRDSPMREKLAAYCGLVPCLRKSGKMKARGAKRKYYNRKLKGTFFNIAFTAIRVNPIARSYYEKKRREGKNSSKSSFMLG